MRTNLCPDIMKARLPLGGGKGVSNLQQLALQAQKVQEEMKEATDALEAKEYEAVSGAGAVSVVVTGKMEVKNIEIKPEVVDPEDIEMLSDLVIVAVNEALRNASEDKEKVMEKISGNMNIPGLF